MPASDKRRALGPSQDHLNALTLSGNMGLGVVSMLCVLEQQV